MDLQPPSNLPMHDEPVVPGATPSAPPMTPPPLMPIQSMPTAAQSAPDDMFSGVERNSASPPTPVVSMPVQAMPSSARASVPSPVMPPITPPIAPPSRVMSSLSEAEHPPILHYLLIALAVVVALGLIAGGVWFFAIRRPAQQVMETLPTVPVMTSSTDELSNIVTPAAPAPSDEPITSGDSFTEPEVIPSKPVVTPPVGTNVPPPTSIDPNTAPPMVAATNTVQGTVDPAAVVAPITPPTDDEDQDGLSDAREVELGTDAMKADTDSDGLSDGDEVLKYHTNPLVPDTDGDTFPDGVEIQKGYNPLGTGKCANPACTL